MVKWFPSIIVMAGIYYMSSRTGQELTSLFQFFSSLNWGHLVAYFVLALTFLYPLKDRFTLKRSMVIAILLSVIYGFTDEWHQMYVPGRAPDIYDIMNDTIGASIAMLVYYIYNQRKKNLQ